MNKLNPQTVVNGMLWCLLSMSAPSLAIACDIPLARQVADLLVANEVDNANHLLDDFEQQQPNQPILGLYRGAVLWAQSQNTTKDKRPAAQQKAIDALQKIIERDSKELQEDPAQPERQLSLGMAQAFIARLYLQQNKWFKAYRYGRKARDGLRELIAQHPDQEDAYLILGLYEYYAGSVSPMWKWVTAMIDLSGDAQLGVQYIERAVQNAPVVAPEAARVLLTEVKSPRPQVCDYLSLAQYMREHYDSNPQFSMALQDIYVRCGHADKALSETRQAQNRYLEKYPNLRTPLDIRALIAYREMGDMQNIEAIEPRLQRAPMIWALNKAKANDLIGKRRTAIDDYQALIDDDAAPHWIQKQARKHLDQPYQRFKTQTPQRKLQLSARCS